MSFGLAMLISAFLIVINGFFVAVELAFVASRHTKLEALAEEGVVGAKAAVIATSNITRMLFAAQLGITVASLILGNIAEDAVAHAIESGLHRFLDVPESVITGIGFSAALLLVVFVHTVFGEMVPKNFAIAAPETTSRLLAPIHLLVVAAVRPIIFVLNLMARPLLRLFGVTPGQSTSAHTPAELVRMLDASREGGLVEDHEHKLLTGALDFGDIRVQSIMIPRDQMVTVDKSTSVGKIEQMVVSSGHSRLPVVGIDGQTIVGFIHSKDLVRLPEEAVRDVAPIEVIRRMLELRIEQPLESVLVEMRRRRTHMAVVLGPNDRVVGMVTLEDVLEELVGEIYDESD